VVADIAAGMAGFGAHSFGLPFEQLYQHLFRCEHQLDRAPEILR